MERIGPGDYRPQPWRNGRGLTEEIARSRPSLPSGAPLWRLSRAVVAGGGPFSVFPEYRRWLTLLTGTGLRLTGPGLDIVLGPGETAAFDGALPVTGTLTGGPVEVLNLMAVPEVGATAAVVRPGMRLAWRASGRGMLHGAAGRLRLGRANLRAGGTLLLDPGDAATVLPLGGSGWGVWAAVEGADHVWT